MIASRPYIGHAQVLIAQADAQSARDVAHESAISSDTALRNAERLYMVVHAMWDLLKEKAGLTDADLEAKIREIDMRDGKLDGRDATQTLPHVCCQCGRTILSGHTRCTWCGAQSEGGAFTHSR